MQAVDDGGHSKDANDARGVPTSQRAPASGC